MPSYDGHKLPATRDAWLSPGKLFLDEDLPDAADFLLNLPVSRSGLFWGHLGKVLRTVRDVLMSFPAKTTKICQAGAKSAASEL